MKGRFICKIFENGEYVTKAAHDLKTASLETPQLQDGDSPIVVKEGAG